jgi:hypothetical protein
MAVRFQTAVVNPDGSVVELQSGHNEITDWGMDALAGQNISVLCNCLNLSSAIGPASRIGTGSGTTLSMTVTDATSIAVAATADFFQAGDVGHTLSITGLQELKITSFTSATAVVCATRQGFWLSGAPTAGPYSSFGVHFTGTNTLATQFTSFNTYDTATANYKAELNDSGNSRFIHQRIFLSSAVIGSNWTIRQLGWSADGGANVFGKVNLAAPDVVNIGQKYRVQLQVYSTYTPINIASQIVDWGATIGTYDLAIKQEVINADSDEINFLAPFGTWNFTQLEYFTGAFATVAVKWFGDIGFSYYPHNGGILKSDCVTSDSVYSAGSHTKKRTFELLDTFAIPAATGLTVDFGVHVSNTQTLTIKPNSGTITKPAGYWCALTFPICWTRQLTN